MKDKNVASFMILHYGKPYVAAAVASIYDQVDKICIAYTDQPSQSFPTNLECPDSRKDLLEELAPYMDKIEWLDGHWQHEHEHCDAARAMCGGYEWRFRIDADEVTAPGSVAEWVRQAKLTDYKEFRVPMIHFWRSFSRVCRDSQFPIRLERDNGAGMGWLDSEGEKYIMYHFGYALPTKYIIYKMQVQGHHSEWRNNWFDQMWLTNAQLDLHPVIYIPPFWNAEEFDKNKLPDIMKTHAYFNEDLIEA